MISSTNKLLDYKEFLKYGDKFIETGSAAGEGIQRALEAGFQEVHSIEAQREWYEVCVNRFMGDPRVFLHHGRSSEVLGIPLIKSTNTGVVFFLDAHPSGPLTAGHWDVMLHGSDSEYAQHNIILSELRLIFSWYFEPVIMIDDQHGNDLDNEKYMLEILNWNNQFYDENLGGNNFYKDKIMVAVKK